MIGLRVLIQDETPKVEAAVEKATFRNLGHAAASIRKVAVESIKDAPGPSEPGTPPHTHTQTTTKKGKVRRGQFPRSIAFDHDRATQTAVIGPRLSVVGLAGEAHEFGGEFKGDHYPERPTMAPALEENTDRFASGFAGSIFG